MARTMVTITGLREFQRALREMDAAMPRGIRIALNKASQLVIDYARPRVPSRSGKARASLKVRSSQRQARIAAGGARAPYYPWLDFGGRVGRDKSVRRPFLTEGRYVYPGLKANRDEITDVMGVALADLARESGIEVS